MVQSRQPALPGLGRLPRSTAPRAQHFSAGATAAGYTGPVPGQLVMGVHDLATQKVKDWTGDKTPYEVDPHGFVHEGATSGLAKLGERGIAPEHDLHYGYQAAHKLYSSHGGRFSQTSAQQAAARGETPSDMGLEPDEVREHDAKVKQVRAHWRAQPTVQLPTSTLVHTNQPHDETEGDATDTYASARTGVPSHWTQDREGEGRKRIEKIKADLAGSGPNARIRKPAWIVKQGGRFYALDGHHRIVAAREAGLSHYPAKLWDRDKENGVDA